MKNKKGISLIVLVITIIVMIILAGAIILSLSNGNIIENARIAKFKSNINTYKDELSMSIGDKIIADRSIIASSISIDKNNIKEYISNMTDSDANRFLIVEGKLTYINDSTNLFTDIEKIALEEIGVEPLEKNYVAKAAYAFDTVTNYNKIYINPKPASKPAADMIFGFNSKYILHSLVESDIVIGVGDASNPLKSAIWYVEKGQETTIEAGQTFIVNGKEYSYADGVYSFNIYYNGWISVKEIVAETLYTMDTVSVNRLPILDCNGGKIEADNGDINLLDDYASTAPYVEAP